MTSTSASTARRLSREQLVAALLVGSVVILLGFASGLGISPASTTAAAPPAAVAPGTTTAPDPSAPPTASAAPLPPPVAYVAEPAAPAAPVTVVVAPPAGTPSTAPSPAPTSVPTRTTPTPAPTSPLPSAPPPPACSPGLLTTLLGLLLPTQDGAAPGLLGTLLQSLDQITAATGLLQAAPGDLLGQVTGLLGDPGVLPTGATASPTLAGACTGETQQALTRIAAGQPLPAAVLAVTR